MYNIIRRYVYTHVPIFICTVYTAYLRMNVRLKFMDNHYSCCYPAFEKLLQNYDLHILGIPGEISSTRALLFETEQINNFVYVYICIETSTHKYTYTGRCSILHIQCTHVCT